MSLGLHERRMQRRRRFWGRIVKWILVIVFFGALGTYSYYAGSNLARHEVTVQKEKVEALEETLKGLEQEKAKLERQLRQAVSKVKEWEQAYYRDAPNDQQKEFWGRVEAKLKSGLDAERLAFVIDSAAEPRDCDDERPSKRFILRTPLQKGANDSVSFFSGAVTVTGEGQTSVNEAGQPEAWYDEDKALTLAFTHLDGQVSEAVGQLPLHHQTIKDDWEYRFTAAPGARGFIVVTGQRCRYP